MAQLQLYYYTQLETNVSLLPEQINNEMDDHLLTNLKDKLEGLTIDEGIVIRVIKLIAYDYGIIDKTNFMGTTVYHIKYECLICSPIKNLEMICVLDNIVRGYLIAKNGPVIIAVQFNNINLQKFEVNGDTIIYTETGKPVKKGDYLKVSIINTNNNLGEKQIMVISKLLDLADKSEIKQYAKDQALITDETDADDTKVFI